MLTVLNLLRCGGLVCAVVQVELSQLYVEGVGLRCHVALRLHVVLRCSCVVQADSSPSVFYQLNRRRASSSWTTN